MSRQSIGNVIAIAGRGRLLVRSSGQVRIAQGRDRNVKPPFIRIGSPVLDGRRARIGRVEDIIGPIDDPHIVVQPARGMNSQRLRGAELFTP